MSDHYKLIAEHKEARVTVTGTFPRSVLPRNTDLVRDDLAAELHSIANDAVSAGHHRAGPISIPREFSEDETRQFRNEAFLSLFSARQDSAIRLNLVSGEQRAGTVGSVTGYSVELRTPEGVDEIVFDSIDDVQTAT